MRRWIYAEHWRGWIGHIVLTAGLTLAGEGIDRLFGWNVHPHFATAGAGYYAIDTLHDLTLRSDPWYDHVIDTAGPVLTAVALTAIFRHGDDENGLPDSRFIRPVRGRVLHPDRLVLSPIPWPPTRPVGRQDRPEAGR